MFKIFLRLGFLKHYREFDRNKDQLSLIIGGNSKVTLKVIENDLKNGKPINEPIEFTIDKNDNTGLISDGNHRITSCINAGMDDNFKIPVILKILKGKDFMDRDKAKKFKKLK